MIFVSAILVIGGCSDNDIHGPDVVADATGLQVVLGSDQASVALGDVDRAIAEERPYLAAERLSQGAIPAAHRQIERVRETEVRSARGRDLKERLTQAYRLRLAALETYRDVLGRGEQGMDLAEALRAQRNAEEAIIAIHDALEAIHPVQM